jgi:peptidoglycan/LPS O-acetylase OafA/YrhL
MGTIRFLLAVSILITHSAPLLGVSMLNGDMAVICFFIISGFLMTMILETKYLDRTKIYFINRLLRIFPPYIAALLFAVVIFYTFPNGHHDPYKALNNLLRTENYELFLAAIVSNLTLVGAEFSRYINVKDSGEILFPNFLYRGQGSGAHNFLFVPQAWTLPLELMFYFLAPLVVRLRTRSIAGLTFAVGLAYYLTLQIARSKNIALETSAFFPFQLIYFLFGSLAYRAMGSLDKALKADIACAQYIPPLSFVVAFALIFLAYEGLRVLGFSEQYLYGLFAICIPGIFIFARHSIFDNAIGEYSFPIYLFHYPIAKGADLFVSPSMEGWFTLILTFVISAIYIHLLDRRVEKIRRSIAA